MSFKVFFNIGNSRLFLLFCAFSFSFGADEQIITAQKREQILSEYEKLEAAKSELDSYREATKRLFEQRQAQLLAKEAELNATLALIAQKEQNISEANAKSEAKVADMLAKNEAILNELKKGNNDKMLEAYIKMKDGKIAEVLGAMDAIDAAKLLYRMEAKKISAVLAKMDAAKAVELTNLIREGKIFDENTSKDNSSQNGDENASAN
ncbi:MAG: 5'-nucleosidase [Campylobacter sp.]|uniref:magnesium transporter MgtE N-terminal domain-containing protein n=1 Tax=Campylobacter sp. TaxID=205 RepID=UPI002AA88AEE|nr:5'-nucleosidase [Campylobacter sp.]MCI6580041.1 5'-nucleosidase [Campylobacter sp.]MCI7582496.1 5'-nucleosidase [Campylobacter sp.]MCI7587416.1 5'-nucleosidase [Campylobacter sp.]